MTATIDWQPGDPLYSSGDHPHSRYLFNFRDVFTVDERRCNCADAASWPEPKGGHKIADDPLADAIRRIRALPEEESA